MKTKEGAAPKTPGLVRSSFTAINVLQSIYFNHHGILFVTREVAEEAHLLLLRAIKCLLLQASLRPSVVVGS